MAPRSTSPTRPARRPRKRPGPLRRLLLRLPHIEPRIRQHVLATRIEYRYRGLLHNDNDQPAVIDDNGEHLWFRHGLLHRDGGPARTWTRPGGWTSSAPAGYRADFPRLEWYRDGERHREDGPALIHGDSREEYWLDGQQLDRKAWRKSVQRLRSERRDAARSRHATSISSAMNRR